MPTVEGMQGEVFRGWNLQGEIGRGADGIVYSASGANGPVAIKLYFPEALKRNGIAAARERLELQIGLAGKEIHQNVVKIIDGGEAEEFESLFLVMEHVPGTSLDKLLGVIPRESIPRLAGQLAAAAMWLESLDLAHRDIKPANIIISDDFLLLTLLDFGVVHRVLVGDGERDEDLSGEEFVATLRYSPPEFVWRNEERNADGAWRAITFYQIGATLHDMIEGKLIFKGDDVPRGCLYDAVRYKTPSIHSKDVPSWLVQTTEACLIKDWRQRLELVSWEAFMGPGEADNTNLVERRIRLRQIRNAEIRRHAPLIPVDAAGAADREHILWSLYRELMIEIRTYLMDAAIFPKCHLSELKRLPREYLVKIDFDQDEERGFSDGVSFEVGLLVDPDISEATRLLFSANLGGSQSISSAWTEMFSVESSFNICRQSFLDAVEIMLS